MRFLFSKIMDRLYKDDRIIIITGPRQSGKTTLMKQVRAELKKDDRPTFFFNLEDRDYLTAFNESPKNLIKLLPGDKAVTVFVDEVQYLENPSNFLKYIYDEYKETIKLLVSGSSAFYIDKKFDDSLSGRKWLFVLYPMGFKEYLYFRNEDIYSRSISDGADIFQPALRRELEILFEDYMLYGGFPEVVLQYDNELRREVLSDLIYSYLKKDIKDCNVKYEDKFYNVLRLLASQVGNLVNKNELCNIAGLSQTAVNHYLYVLKKTFCISLISPFSSKTAKEITKMPKVFFFDNGIRNIVLKDFTELELRRDKGSLLENTVFQYFSGIHKIDEIRFWRKKGGTEIDFIIDHKAYEVKYSSATIKKAQLKSFKAANPEKDLSILYYRKDVSKSSYLYIPAFFLMRGDHANRLI